MTMASVTDDDDDADDTRERARDPLLDESENVVTLHSVGHQIRLNIAVLGAYFMFHFSRKCYSTVKQQLQNQAGFSALMLSSMDAVFISIYTATLITNRKLSDLFSPSVSLVIGLAGTGFCLLLINVALWFDFHGMNTLLGNIFILVIAIFGFFQAAEGPSKMDNWLLTDEKAKRRGGLVVESWSCHQFCGDIVAGICTSWVLGIGLPYWWALLIPAFGDFIWSFIASKLIAGDYVVGAVAAEVNIRQKEPTKAERKETAEEQETVEEDATISYTNTLVILMVVQYAFIFGFIKIISYVLYFWLPYFLGKSFDPVTANLLASLYSVGMLSSGVVVGCISYLFEEHRLSVIGVFMSVLLVLLGLFARHSETLPATSSSIVLGCAGVLVGG